MEDINTPSELLRALEAVADATLIFDNHAHPFWIYNPPRPPAPLCHVLTKAFPPELSSDLPEQHPYPSPLCRSTLAFRRSLNDIHHLLSQPALPSVSSNRSSTSATSSTAEYRGARRGPRDLDVGNFEAECDVENAVEALRTELGVWGLAKRCFEAAGVAAVLLDDGLKPPAGARGASCGEFEEILGVGVARRLIRLETVAEEVLNGLIEQNVGNVWGRAEGKRARMSLKAGVFKKALWERLDPLPDGVVGFKSMCGYRGGLGVRLDWSEEELENGLGRAVLGGPLEERVVVDFVVKCGMEAARLHDIPVQFHCGFGDRDLDLQLADPCLLKAVLERFSEVKVVLLHAAWPYMRKAAHLTSVYPGVYVDLGLAIPLLSVGGMMRVVEEVLEIAPVRKVMYSSDAVSVPDAYYLGARWGRRVIAAGVANCVAGGDLSLAEGKRTVRMILAENAVRVYKLHVDV